MQLVFLATPRCLGPNFFNDLVLRAISELDRIVEEIIILVLDVSSGFKSVSFAAKDPTRLATHLVPMARVRVQVYAAESIQSFEEMCISRSSSCRPSLNGTFARLHLLHQGVRTSILG